MDTSTVENTISLEVTRKFSAKISDVYNAFVNPKLIASWFPMPGCVNPGADVDLTIDGTYSWRMTTPDGKDIEAHGKFIEIQENKKLVFTWSWRNLDWESLITIDFVDLGDDTEITLIHEKFLDENQKTQHTEGWGKCFDSIDANVL